jgi:hypothetical protein
MDNARWTPDMIAGLVIDSVKKDKMYVVPQAAAKLLWISKRFSPSWFFGAQAFLIRMGWGRKLMYFMAKMGM